MKIQVGKIIKAQGIKGEVKLASLIDDAETFKGFKYLYLNDSRIGVNSVRVLGNFVYILFSTITDRSTAEELRGWNVFADKEQLPIEDGRFFVGELIGCHVSLDDGSIVGELEEILQKNGAADVYVVAKDGKRVLFPFLKDLVSIVDVENREIVLFAKRFSEVSVDEN